MTSIYPSLSALAEPNRLKIVELLKTSPSSVNSIAQALGIRQPQVSKHLKVLHDEGFVSVQVDAQRRVYRLDGKPFEELSRWVENFRHVWEANYQRLDALLIELQSKQGETP